MKLNKMIVQNKIILLLVINKIWNYKMNLKILNNKINNLEKNYHKWKINFNKQMVKLIKLCNIFIKFIIDNKIQKNLKKK